MFQDINKRLSLPADIRLPDDYLEKFNVIGPALFEQPISRRLRRVSLVSSCFYCVSAVFLSFWNLVVLTLFSLCLQSEIGFGKLETYVKLDKLGEVRSQDKETV